MAVVIEVVGATRSDGVATREVGVPTVRTQRHGAVKLADLTIGRVRRVAMVEDRCHRVWMPVGPGEERRWRSCASGRAEPGITAGTRRCCRGGGARRDVRQLVGGADRWMCERSRHWHIGGGRAEDGLLELRRPDLSR